MNFIQNRFLIFWFTNMFSALAMLNTNYFNNLLSEKYVYLFLKYIFKMIFLRKATLKIPFLYIS